MEVIIKGTVGKDFPQFPKIGKEALEASVRRRLELRTQDTVNFEITE